MGCDALEIVGLLVLKLMIAIIMDVDDSALQVLTQSLQNCCLKNVPGEKNMAVGYLKGALLLLQI